ncbi:hypothetical protein P4E94_15790, partial [Pontiellaceae bacterium B12219]|nr:hypothetical protein [Pontiellaceae bacterium B12219]
LFRFTNRLPPDNWPVRRKLGLCLGVNSDRLLGISQESIGNFPISLPSIKEQEEIVRYLETQTIQYDKGIGHFHDQIDRLKEYKTTLINSAVTGKIRVPLAEEIS